MRKRVRAEPTLAGGPAPRRRPRIDYERWLGPGAPAPPQGGPVVASMALSATGMPLTSLTAALPSEVVAELIEYMLATGREAQAIGICSADRETRLVCEETTVDPERLGLPLTGRRSLLDTARALVTLRDPRRCILWAWLLATQAIVDAHTAPRTVLGGALPRRGATGRRDQLVRHTDLDLVTRNDLLLWATSRSPGTMPIKAQTLLASAATRPYLWRALVAYAYGVPTGPTPYGMAPGLYADPREPQSGLVSLDRFDEPLPEFATVLDEVQYFPSAVPLGLPPNFPYLDFESMARAVQTPEYASIARRRVVDALSAALDGTKLSGFGCVERLFSLFDVRVFVLPSATHLRHYASIRLRPQVDISPFDPIDYWRP
ncbi:hypothetical protein pkur_cds_92 [Pandoravirus kuranda]|uniref:Uncharacterized protein n=1 Tax=Pandoravirus kuranda TaxID=3019033 RepID=A0AA95EDS7_9VIRU|nr:hypothetical protein pkur_cds_92 [Pandoravirus kuranda]